MTDRTMESMDSMYSPMRSPLPNGQYEMDIKLRQAVAITSNSESKCEHYLKYKMIVI